MKKFFVIAAFIAIASSACNNQQSKNIDAQEIDSLLNKWHQAAANADSLAYFALFDSSAVFIGTDPGERWTMGEFRTYVIPFFRQGRGWNFEAIERNIRSDESGNFVWFDERLKTWMGPCLSTGILRKEGEQWKLVHYHLAFTVPNEDIRDVLEMLDSLQKNRLPNQ